MSVCACTLARVSAHRGRRRERKSCPYLYLFFVFDRERAREREYGLKESLKNERVNGRVAGESEFD